MTSLLSCALRCGSRPYDGAICRRLGPGHNQQGAGLTFISLQIRVSYIHITYPYPMTMKFIEASKPNSHAFDSIKQKHNILQEIRLFVLTAVCVLVCWVSCSFQHLFICVTTLQLLDNNTTIITVSTQQTCHFVDLSFGTPSPPSKCGVSVWLVMSLNLKSKNEIHPWPVGAGAGLSSRIAHCRLLLHRT